MMLRSLALGAALAAVASVALAQPYYVERRAAPYAPAYVVPQQRVYGGPPPEMCQRWCPQDASPCDPANFKIADGRCRPALFDR